MLKGIFGPHKAFIGVVHLPPLPGSPRWRGDMGQVLARARDDARALAEGGCAGLIVENYGDAPFVTGRVESHTVAAMVSATQVVQDACGLPVGINMLRNDPRSAIAVAVATGARFVRINIHYGVMAADEGLVEGMAHETLRYRRNLGAEGQVSIFADVLVKHAVPLGNTDLAYVARETVLRGLADVLIITGAATGEPAAPEDVAMVKAATAGVPVLVGSGLDESNAASFLALADGAIVGTSLKMDGVIENPVDPRRVARLSKVFKDAAP